MRRLPASGGMWMPPPGFFACAAPAAATGSDGCGRCLVRGERLPLRRGARGLFPGSMPAAGCTRFAGFLPVAGCVPYARCALLARAVPYTRYVLLARGMPYARIVPYGPCVYRPCARRDRCLRRVPLRAAPPCPRCGSSRSFAPGPPCPAREPDPPSSPHEARDRYAPCISCTPGDAHASCTQCASRAAHARRRRFAHRAEGAASRAHQGIGGDRRMPAARFAADDASLRCGVPRGRVGRAEGEGAGDEFRRTCS